jgi:hypothetical protein
VSPIRRYTPDGVVADHQEQKRLEETDKPNNVEEPLYCGPKKGTRWALPGGQTGCQSAPRGEEDCSTKPTQHKNHYELLGVDKMVTNEEMKKAYCKKALFFHPDKLMTLPEVHQHHA